MRSIDTRAEQIEKESESVKPGSTPVNDYVNLMKGASDVARNLPSTPADKNLPNLVTEDKSQKEKQREGSDTVSSKPESKNTDSVDILMKKLGVSMDQKTDPNLLKDILHNDMKLDDCPAAMKLLGARLIREESMKPMLETIRTSILTKQPELHEFISTALKENLLPEPTEAGQKLILRSLNHMVILDALTKGMADDPQVMEDIRNHLLNKRKEIGIRDGFLTSAYDIFKAEAKVEGKPQDGLFGAVKTKSVDVAIDLFLELRKHGQVSKLDSLKASTLLEVNIAEAILADVVCGYRNNAIAGMDLDLHPASKVWLSDKTHAVNYGLSQSWDSLYESWNMAFITQCTNPQLLFPKLLIPEVINAKPEEYIFNRALALWLTLNFDHFRAVEKKEAVLLPGGKEITKRWGEINRSYGKTLPKN